ncbi:MAG: trigger factor [Eubacterium sp.]|nr:trigger factor [Eubacterium sp.]
MKKKFLTAVLCLTIGLSASGCGASASEKSASETSSAQGAASASASVSVSEAEDMAESSSSLSSVSSSSESLTERIMAIPVQDGDFKLQDAITPGNYKNLSLTRQVQKVTDDDVTSYIQSQMTPEEVTDKNATAENGDTVDIAYTGKINGKAFEGGSSDSYDLTLGSGTFIDGFEDGVVGMKKGETKDLQLKFPDSYYAEDLAGKEVVFTVTVNEIKRKPELTDAWVQDYTNGSVSTVEDYRKSVKKTLEQQSESNAESALQGDAWNQVENASTYHFLPAKYVDAGEETFEKNVKAEARQYGLSLDEYIEQTGMDQETYNQQKEQNGRYAAASRLLLDAMVKAEKLSEDSPAYKRELKKAADQYDVTTDKLISENGEENVYNYVMTQVVLSRIIRYADVTEAESTGTETGESLVSSSTSSEENAAVSAVSGSSE